MNGDAVKRRLRNAIGRCPTVGAIGQLAAAARHVHDARRIALFQERHERLRHQQRPERVRAQCGLEYLGRDLEDILVVIEQNTGVVYQCIETIAAFRKILRCASNAVRFGDVDLQKRDLAVVFFLTFFVEFFRRWLASLLVTRPEKNMKTFARQLPHNFKPDPFVRAGHERDVSLFCHEGTLIADHVELNGSNNICDIRVISGYLFLVSKFVLKMWKNRSSPGNLLRRTMAELEASSDNPGVIAFPPLIWLVSVVVSALVHFFVIRLPIMNYSACLVCGIVLVILAPTLAWSALVTMKAAGTNVNPSKPALTIVGSGPYRFTRNPMYLALTLLQIGAAFLLNDAITLLFAAALALIFHCGVILREERYLEAKFGEEYLALKRSVRRWI